MRKEDLDIVGKLFGIRFIPGGSPEGCFELYVEDDERYYHKLTVNNFWLKDLQAVVKEALNDEQ
jgi:hypothetical protein